MFGAKYITLSEHATAYTLIARKLDAYVREVEHLKAQQEIMLSRIRELEAK